MKVELEITGHTEDSLIASVRDALVLKFYNELKVEFTTLVRNVVLVTVRDHAREMAKNYLENEDMPDGRKYVDHVRDFMLRKAVSWSERTRIDDLVNREAFAQAEKFFREEAGKHITEFKKQFATNLIDMFMKG